MRKAFNFYKSYYDVYNLLSDKEKVKFIDALLKRQFTGEESTLSGQANFAYTSQKEVIDKQIKGWEDKTGNKLSTPTEGGAATPRQQEKGQGQGQEQEKEKEKDEKLSLFKNSIYFDKRKFHEAIIKTDFEFDNIDYKHYYESLLDWSESGGKMKKDWIATVRGWIRRDIKNQELKIKIPKKKIVPHWNEEEGS